MKKNIFIYIALMIFGFSFFAQNSEIVGKIPYEYWNSTNWESGVQEICIDEEKIYFIGQLNQVTDYYYYDFYVFTKENGVKQFIELPKESKYFYTEDAYIPYGIVLGYNGAGKKQDEINLYVKYKGKEWNIVSKNSKVDFNCNMVYMTDNTLFTYGQNGIICIKLLDNGKYKILSDSETKKYLTDSKCEEIGLHLDEKSGNLNIGNFGYFIDAYGILWKYDDVKFQKKNYQYETLYTLNEKFYDVIGTDSKGLVYLNKLNNTEGTFDIAVLDIWTKKAYFYEGLKENGWTIPNGVSPKYTFAVSPDGEFYYIDTDKYDSGKKEYYNGNFLIKKIPNFWYKDIGIDSRNIGMITTNHIPLYKNPSEDAETDGFNFENDIVWEKERKNGWSRIQNIDGREGWVKSDQIYFEKTDSKLSAGTEVQTVSIVEEDKIMKVSDNLKLRKAEDSYSEVITTMKKGTKVRILKLGKEETIDGITSNWVQVKVLTDAKDKNGKEIKFGTVGWCYGGYLED